MNRERSFGVNVITTKRYTFTDYMNWWLQRMDWWFFGTRVKKNVVAMVELVHGFWRIWEN